MRKKRKRKTTYTRGKLLISIMVCLTLVFATVNSNNHSEALAVSSLTQPINIMYSLLTKRHFDHIDEMNGSMNNKLQAYYTLKKKLAQEQNKQPLDDQEVKNKPEEHDPAQSIKTSNLEENGSVKHEDSQKNQQNEQKVIYLTFDDGPSAFTLDILQTLNTYNMKATFFMLEPNMRAYPKELDAIIKNGHIPALHGVTHNVAKIYRSEKTVVNEMAIAQATLMKMTGTGTSLIRTPYGSAPYMKPSYKEAVEAAGFHLWDWTVDSEDWKYKNGEYVDRVIGQIEQIQHNDKPIIILLHDLRTTAEHLPALLTYLQTNGYQAEVLNEQLSAFHF
ncbi:polysaccharide deacetylase family protein [Bacillus sp. DTU_2020_1000418_1_SI_GHA_SEK_038]|uniref:polysaccharide deacetylase family protein n=1 Tax=Bacillus sp. DTU_2020_1000418_1_SI_GHA_SEK_038 TaxID=3077585 RepID=UPI0028E5740B|nr:polysaccharide deacetylase family protein [Bacillus sp. DTU_2020_1000418_1_SI_GHA_SEK_038]WNS73811.1 polysaccharide deacetylase family protein [Bacillus sp. DTU_2020_1000418_1_SI_GHA_SEK_038]